jgi:RNase H-fold protein (predicted Holliday junction resolvase)
VVVWGGTRGVGRNETEKGLNQIKNFARKHNHTNVIVMSVPHRYNLESTLCVNNEVKVYNRELKKHLKVFSDTCVIEVDSYRNFFTRHGLHMNSKDKEQTARQIAKTIKVMLNEKKSDPIIMKNKEDPTVDSEQTEAESTAVEIETNQEQTGTIWKKWKKYI